MGASSPIRAESWPEVSLVDITTKIGSGSTPRGGSETYLKERAEYALVRSQNVFDRHFESDGLAFISTEQAAGLKGVTLQPGDILLNITGDGVTFGRACVIPESVRPACVNQHVAIVRVDPRKAHFGYVLSFLTHPEVKGYIESFNAGGSRRAITKAHIESFRLPLPPLPEQRAIAHILGTLDDKIELNRRTNETLEAMARALFKSWFVDFDPVHAKKAGRKPEGLDAETAALFPDDFEDSEMGKIPRGWRVAHLSALTSYLSRGIGPSYVEEGGVRVVNQKCVRAGVLDFSKARRHDVSRRSVDDRILLDGDILVNSTGVGTLGRVAQADSVSEPTIVDSHVTVVRPREPSLLEFLGTSMTSRESEIEALGEGSTGQTELSRQRLGALPFVVAPDAVTRAFGGFAAPSRRRRAKSRAQSETLAALRDTLLPQLLSGSLRVPEAMRIVEKAL